jgi:hypothetical protein
MISITSDYTYEDGSVSTLIIELSYDAEEPEKLGELLGYVNQTENLRNVTVVSNPGTDKEESKRIQAAKGLVIGVEYADDLEYAPEFYTDAACTAEYAPYADTNSDLTIYVKRNRENN